MKYVLVIIWTKTLGFTVNYTTTLRTLETEEKSMHNTGEIIMCQMFYPLPNLDAQIEGMGDSKR